MQKVLAIILAFAFTLSARAADATLPLKELIDLLRTNATSITQEELDKAAANGLLTQLGNRVRIPSATPAQTNGAPIAATAQYDGIAYLRVNRVNPALPDALWKTWQEVRGQGKVRGIVLDLRFAEGEDYEAAAKTAALFIKDEVAILKAGEQTHRVPAKEAHIDAPVVVLCNNQTRAAAEALAGAVRALRNTLIIGGPTAGAARTYKEFTLSNGSKVELASGWVELSNGQTIPEGGLQPDLPVNVAWEVERSYLADPFKGSPFISTNEGGLTNRLARRLMNEAELMRRQRREADVEPVAPQPSVADPVLARGLDILKGMNVFHKSGF